MSFCGEAGLKFRGQVRGLFHTRQRDVLLRTEMLRRPLMQTQHKRGRTAEDVIRYASRSKPAWKIAPRVRGGYPCLRSGTASECRSDTGLASAWSRPEACPAPGTTRHQTPDSIAEPAQGPGDRRAEKGTRVCASARTSRGQTYVDSGTVNQADLRSPPKNKTSI